MCLKMWFLRTKTTRYTAFDHIYGICQNICIQTYVCGEKTNIYMYMSETHKSCYGEPLMSRIGIVNYSRNWKNHIPSPRLWLPENLLFKLWCKLCHGFWKLSNGYYSWCQMWSVVPLVVRRGSHRCRLIPLAYSQVHVSCWPHLRIVLVTPVMKSVGTAPEVSLVLVPVQAIVWGVGALPFRAALAIFCANHIFHQANPYTPLQACATL